MEIGYPVNSSKYGTKRFGELAREASIFPRILSKELNELEMNQLVSREACNTKPVTVEYTATPYAGTLKEVIDAMIRWSENHRKKSWRYNVINSLNQISGS